MSNDIATVVEIVSGLPTVAAVSTLENFLLTFPQTDLGTRSLVHGGMCARTILIPARTILTGALTNLDNVSVVYGDITVTTDEGAQRLTGFHVLPAKAGAKRAGVAHADTYWTMVWPTELTDLEEIENEITTESGKLQTRQTTLLTEGD